jgi:phage terminase Nu1 subunit (DNA packaging protein)
VTKKVRNIDFARAIGVHPSTVTELVRAGVVDLGKGLEQSIIAYCAHLREKAAGRSGNGEINLVDERARLAHHQANLAAIEQSVREGELVRVADVLEESRQIAEIAKSHWLAFPSRIAAVLVQQEGEREIERALRDGVQSMLHEYAEALCRDDRPA